MFVNLFLIAGGASAAGRSEDISEYDVVLMNQVMRDAGAQSVCPCTLPEGLARSTLACGKGVLVGTGSGVKEMAKSVASPVMEVGHRLWLGVKSLWDDKAFGELAKIGEKDQERFKKVTGATKWVWERNVLIGKAAAGDQAARTKLANIGEDDRKRVGELTGAIKQATANMYVEFRTQLSAMSPEKQSQFLCEKIGRLSFDGLAMVAGGKSATTVLKFLGKEELLAEKGAAMAAKGARAAGRSNASIVEEALAKMRAGGSKKDILKIVGQLNDAADGGKARLELAAKVLGRPLSAAEKDWVMAAHNTHPTTAYGEIGAQKVRDKIKAGGGRPKSVSGKDTRALMENGILGNPGTQLYNDATLRGYASIADDSLGKQLLGKTKERDVLHATENRLAGDTVLYRPDLMKKYGVNLGGRDPMKVAMGFYEKDYQHEVASLAKYANPSYRSLYTASDSAMRTGRVTEAVQLLKRGAEARSMYEKGLGNNLSAAEDLVHSLKDMAEYGKSKPKWVRDNMKAVIEEVLKDGNLVHGNGPITELQRAARNLDF